MISLYQWLIENKEYSEFEAEETLIRYHNSMEIPIEVKNDIKEYTYEYLQKFCNEVQ